MASIVPYRGGYRAHIHAQGVRESRLFQTRREAVAWAARREEELATGGGCQLTFAQAAERWLAWKLPRLSNDENVRTVEQSIREHVLPLIGHRKLTEIKRRELVDVVKRLAEGGKVETAHRVGQRIRSIFDHAIDHGDIETHPAARLSRVLPVARPRHMPAITAAELPGLLKAIDGYPESVTRLGLLLLAHTFVRTNELIGARWDEIRDPETWVVPAERVKGMDGKRLPHVVPLSAQSRAILEELRKINADSRYILASPTNEEASISKNTLLFALYRLGYRGKMTGHGFRSVASTVLNESGLWSRDAIERQLAHKETDEVRAAYHRAEHLDERRKLMEWWSSYLASSAR